MCHDTSSRILAFIALSSSKKTSHEYLNDEVPICPRLYYGWNENPKDRSMSWSILAYNLDAMFLALS